MQSLEFERYTVAWIAPLEIEALAARAMLDHEHQGTFSYKRGDRYTYTAGNINGHNVVIATFPVDHPYGTNSAADLASDIVQKFPNLWFGLLVGVAAGLPDLSRTPPLDIRLGDVLVATGIGDYPAVVNYDFGKETAEGFQLSPRGVLPKTAQIVRAAIGKIKNGGLESFSRHYREATYRNPIFADPGQEADYSYQAGSILHRQPRHRVQRTQVFYGPIGSGNRVVKDDQTRDELRDKHSIIGLEMEAAGILNILPVGVIRGVSDYGDAQKNKYWQPYAAITAAAYAKCILCEISCRVTPRAKGTTLHQHENSLVVKRFSDGEACLRSLSFLHMDDRQNDIAQAHKDTCGWIFETPEFCKWHARSEIASHYGVLWIKGKAGSGKSTLMKYIWSQCQRNFGGWVTLAYFFNAQGSELQRTPLGLFRSLLFQFVDSLPDVFDRFYARFQAKDKKHGTRWDWHLGELKDFFLEEMQICRSEPILFLIDALDECTEQEVSDVAYFIELLSKEALASNNTVNICLSSRHYPTITIARSLDLELEVQAGHDEDIALYIVSRLKVDDFQIIEELLHKADHAFMWVALVVTMLNREFDQGREWAIRRKLDELPSDLEEVYRLILKKDNPHKEETVLLLQWVLFAERLLSPEALYLAVLAGTHPDEMGYWDQLNIPLKTVRKYITDTSRGLVEIRGSGWHINVQFMHYSVNDFLLRKKRLSQLDQSLEDNTRAKCHSRLAICCMQYIQGSRSSHPESPPVYRDHFLIYALGHLLSHAEEAESEILAQHGFFQWLHQQVDKLISLNEQVSIDSNFETGAGLVYNLSLTGRTSLLAACLQEGLSTNGQGGKYCNPLQAASAKNFPDSVELLLEYGAEVNVQEGFCDTALKAAAESNSPKVVELLLQYGAEVNIQGGFYGTALQAAAANSAPEVVQLFLEHGAEVNARGGKYGNALQAASAAGCLKAVKLLLSHGARVNSQGGKHGTALQAASTCGSLGVVKLLLSQGAEVNIQGGCNGTALLGATVYGFLDIVKELLKHGAQTDARGGRYGNVFKAAVKSRYTRRVRKQLLEILSKASTRGGAEL